MRFKSEGRLSGTGAIYHFLKPNMNGDLILQYSVNNLPTTKYYILEEQVGSEDRPASLFTRHGGESYGNRSRNSMRIQWSDDNDRLYNLGPLIIKLLGYDMTTTPSVSEILRNTKLQYKKDMDGLLVQDDSIYSLDSASVLGNYYMRKRKSLKSKPKRTIKRCSCKRK
jgi:hypothetical protein